MTVLPSAQLISTNARLHPDPAGQVSEVDRLRALRAYQLLDSPYDHRFGALVDSAAALLDVEFAAIILVDAERLWRLAARGAHPQQSARAGSLSEAVIERGHVTACADLAADPRLSACTLPAGPRPVRSFAGVPLIGRDGLAIGVFSVADFSPREFSDAQLTALSALTDAAVALMEQHRNDAEAGRSARPPLSQQIEGSNFSAAGIRQALQRGEFEVYYQPIVSIPTGRLVGLEALARWNVPELGLIAPQYFLPHIEGSPLLSQSFCEYVLDSACLALAQWRHDGADELRMSVNVSGYEVTGGSLPGMVKRAVTAARVPYELLTLEITETVNLSDRQLAIDHLGRVRDLGVRVTLDDFGVGYSSLEFAGVLPITGLKLDREFVANLQASGGAMSATLASVVQLCNTLNLELVGEGVETQQAADLLVRAGVPLAQGYYYSRPMPAACITELVSNGSSRALATARRRLMPTLPAVAAATPPARRTVQGTGSVSMPAAVSA